LASDYPGFNINLFSLRDSPNFLTKEPWPICKTT